MRTVRPKDYGVLLALAALGALTACGGDDEPRTAETTTASTPVETTASESPSDEPTEVEEPTEEETTEAGADVDIEVTIVGAAVTVTADRVPVEVGQTVRITVTGDTDDEVHVHGFELVLPIVAGTPGELEFEVGTSPGPGLYEVETHDGGLLLFQLEVR